MLRKLVVVALLLGSLVHAQPSYKLAVTAIFQNEGRFLREWIEYHKLVGVEHFYLYNHLSSDNPLEVLEPYTESGEVTLIDWPFETPTVESWRKVEFGAYRDGLARADCEWLAIIDIDEFLVPVAHENLLDLIAEYAERDDVGGICLPWVMFGTSGVERIPDDRLMIELLVRHGTRGRGRDAGWVRRHILHKSIVRPECVTAVPNSHWCRYVEGKRHHFVPHEKGQINHYWTRDEQFLREVKIPRRKRLGCSENWCYQMAGILRWRTEFGVPILRFVPRLREAMGMDVELEDLCE